MSGGATQRSRTGPRSLISRQLIRAALRALINGPMEAGSSERQGRAIMCRFDSRSLPGGRSRPRHHGPAASSGQRGPATATLALNGKPTPHRGGPREAGCGVLGVLPPNSSGMALRSILAPGWVTSYTNFGAQSCRLTGITAARREGGLEGAGRGRARCTVKFNSLNIPLLKAAA